MAEFAHTSDSLTVNEMISPREIDKFKRDQHKTALHAASIIDDRDSLCDVLEMLGLDVVPAV